MMCNSLAIPDHAFSIPQSLDQDELSKLVNEIIGDLCTIYCGHLSEQHKP